MIEVNVINIYLIRHGLKQKAVGDVSLTKQGIEQAQAIATYFTDKSIVPECSITTLSYYNNQFNIEEFANINHLCS